MTHGISLSDNPAALGENLFFNAFFSRLIPEFATKFLS
jgi:hypothetical protein